MCKNLCIYMKDDIRGNVQPDTYINLIYPIFFPFVSFSTRIAFVRVIFSRALVHAIREFNIFERQTDHMCKNFFFLFKIYYRCCA